MKADLDKIRSELKYLEEQVLSNNAPYANDASEQFYAAIKKLTEATRQLQSLSLNNESGDKSHKHIELLFEIIDKLRRTIQTRPPYGVYVALLDEAIDLGDAIMSEGKVSRDETHAITENNALREEIKRYRDVERSMEEELMQYKRQMAEYDKRSLKIEAAAEKLTRAVEEKTSREWTDEYYECVKYDYSYKKGKRHQLLEESKRIYCFVIKDMFFYRGRSYSNLVNKSQAWRLFWLTLLLTGALLYLINFWNYDFNDTDWVQFLLDKSKFLPLIILIGIGFTYASRIHRVNLHLLEQYKHRYVVAKTMNNLMTLESLNDDTVKAELIQQGSKILFEFKNSGHMNKSDKSTIDDYQKIISSLTGAAR